MGTTNRDRRRMKRRQRERGKLREPGSGHKPRPDAAGDRPQRSGPGTDHRGAAGSAAGPDRDHRGAAGSAAGPDGDHWVAAGSAAGPDNYAKTFSALLSLLLDADAPPLGTEDRRAVVEVLIARLPGRLERSRLSLDIENLLANQAVRLLGGGWSTEELVPVIRRKATAAGAALVAGALDRAIAGGRANELRTDERDDIRRLARTARSLDHHRSSWPSDLAQALHALAVLGRLPMLKDLGPIRRASGHRESRADDRLLARVRALLAKAESTDYPEEAEAFLVKAQDLMTRHRLDRTVVEDDESSAAGSPIDARRCWLDEPYVRAKSMLLGVIATANGCRGVRDDELAMVTIVGHPDDLDITEVLFTSLLVQATRQMALLSSAAGAGRVEVRRARTPAFRRSFLISYANRIGQRLAEAARAATEAAVADYGDRLLPVLARQADAADEAVRKLFPHLRNVRVRISDEAGWAAGRAAADLADLATQRPLPRRATG